MSLPLPGDAVVGQSECQVWARVYERIKLKRTKAERRRDDAEQAQRLAKIAVHRLHERRRRAEEAK